MRRTASIAALASAIALGACAYPGKSRSFVPILERTSVEGIREGLDGTIRSNAQVIRELGQRPDGRWLRFAVVGDTLSSYNYAFRQILAEISKLDPIPAFIVNLGDFSAGLPKYSYYLETIRNYPHPIIHLMGNHEIAHGGEPVSKALIGDTDFSFDHGGLRFVFMGAHQRGLTDERLEWLEGKLKAGRPSNKVLLAHEFPVGPFKGLFKGLYFPFAKRRKNEDRLLELLDRYDVRLALFGHLHRFQALAHDGTVMIISGGGGQRSFLEPRAKQPLSTKQKSFTLVDILAEEGCAPQGVVTCVNRHGQPLFMNAFYEDEGRGGSHGSNGGQGEASLRFVPYRPDDGGLEHPPYIGELYRAHQAVKAGSGVDR